MSELKFKVGEKILAMGTVDAIGRDGTVRVDFNSSIGDFTAYFADSDINHVDGVSGPAWHPRPTCEGLWVSRLISDPDAHETIEVTDDDLDGDWNCGYQFFGPIPYAGDELK